MTSKLSHYSGAAPKQQAPEPRPSASIVLLSPTNQVLLVHRVKTSSAFPSAHVFPGGNLSDFHDGSIPATGDAQRHWDGPAYRMGAIREAFEESGILIARPKGPNSDSQGLLSIPESERDSARKAIYDNKIKFGDWLDKVGGVADTGRVPIVTTS